MRLALQVTLISLLLLITATQAVDTPVLPLPYLFASPAGWQCHSRPQSDRTDWISPDKKSQISIVASINNPATARELWYFFAPELEKGGISILSSRVLTDSELFGANCDEGYEAILQGESAGRIKTRSILWLLVKDESKVFMISATAPETSFSMQEKIIRQSLDSFCAKS